MLSIGTLAKAADVTTPTILPKPYHGNGEQRQCDHDDLGRLTFLRQCPDFGFSIGQVRLLLDLSISSDCSCADRR